MKNINNNKVSTLNQYKEKNISKQDLNGMAIEEKNDMKTENNNEFRETIDKHTNIIRNLSNNTKLSIMEISVKTEKRRSKHLFKTIDKNVRNARLNKRIRRRRKKTNNASERFNNEMQQLVQGTTNYTDI